MEELIARYGERVRRLMRRLLPGEADREDAVQETWLALLRTPSEAPPGWPYVRRTAYAKAVDRLRRRAFEPLRADPTSRGDGAEPDEVPLNRLPEHERRTLELRFWAGLSIEEIARELKVPEGTVKTWLHRGRRRLRQILESEEGRHGAL